MKTKTTTKIRLEFYEFLSLYMCFVFAECSSNKRYMLMFM